jgi:hypothetical protein
LCTDLLERAFSLQLQPVTAGRLATDFATEGQRLKELYQVTPAAFLGDSAAGNVTWWNGMADNFDYLGNEFLLWLWWHWETQSDTITLGDQSEATGMFARTLTLDCPLAESGRETISAECPVALPEAVLAIRSGKLPRKAGLTVVRHDEQYDLAIQAETFTVSGAKIKQLGTDDSGDIPAEDRITSFREMNETLDLLFQVFCDRRLGKAWKTELKAMRQWLQVESSSAARKPAA